MTPDITFLPTVEPAIAEKRLTCQADIEECVAAFKTEQPALYKRMEELALEAMVMSVKQPMCVHCLALNLVCTAYGRLRQQVEINALRELASASEGEQS